MAKPSFSSQSWKLRDTNDELVKSLCDELNLQTTVARVLVHRGIAGVEEAKSFLNTSLKQLVDPFLLKDMTLACDRIIKAIQNDEKICIYGDYDVDGSVGTALLVLFFKDLGIDIDFYIPCRQREGYSLNNEALGVLKDRGVQLLITVDNGITSNESVLHANEIGLDVVITDHHQIGESLPEAVAVVNPQRADCSYPYKGICGAGVAFKLIMALRSVLREQGFFKDKTEPHLKQYFDVLCLSTICDVVPLTGENRLFVKEGLKHLRHTKRPGLMALKDVCRIQDDVSVTDVGFRMGPRLNAAGRLDDASHGVRLLISDNYENAYKYAAELDRLNTERREIEQGITEEVMQRLADKTLPEGVVEFDASWHVGVVGIVASRIVDRFHRPTFILCEPEPGVLKGSGRSFGAINLVKALQDCSELLEKFGGHEAAAGVTLKKENLAAFQDAFAAAVRTQWQNDEAPQKEILVDEALDVAKIDRKLVDDLQCLEPFGMGNAAPVFVTEGLKVVQKRIVGEKHLKLKVSGEAGTFDAIAFGKSLAFDDIQDSIDLVYGLEINRFAGRESIQLVVKDLENPNKNKG